MTINLDVLDDAITFIKDHPEQHQQAHWTCDTGACVAGWVALLNGYKTKKQFIEDEDGNRKLVTVNGSVYREGHPKHTVSASAIARELLGVTETPDLISTNILFHGTNTIEDIEMMAKDLANGIENLGTVWSEKYIEEDGHCTWRNIREEEKQNA